MVSGSLLRQVAIFAVLGEGGENTEVILSPPLERYNLMGTSIIYMCLCTYINIVFVNMK